VPTLLCRRVLTGHRRERLPPLPARDLLGSELQHKLYAMFRRQVLDTDGRDRLSAVPGRPVLAAKHVLLHPLSIRDFFWGERQLVVPAVPGKDVFHRSCDCLRAMSIRNVQQPHWQISMLIMQERDFRASRIPRGRSRFFFSILALSLPPSYPPRISRYRTVPYPRYGTWYF